MEIFYYDEILQKMWNKLKLSEMVSYMERKFEQEKSVKNLVSLIAFSWYFGTQEGRIKYGQPEEEMDFFSKWKYYFELGLDKYEEPEFFFVGGYIHSLHGFHITDLYDQKLALELMQKM